MPKVVVTVMQMLAIRNEINEYSKNSMTFRLFNADKIDRFLKYNALFLQGADLMIAQMVKKYVKHDEAGNPVLLDQKDGHVKYDFIDEEAAKAFSDEYKSYVSLTRAIEF